MTLSRRGVHRGVEKPIHHRGAGTPLQCKWKQAWRLHVIWKTVKAHTDTPKINVEPSVRNTVVLSSTWITKDCCIDCSERAQSEHIEVFTHLIRPFQHMNCSLYVWSIWLDFAGSLFSIMEVLQRKEKKQQKVSVEDCEMLMKWQQTCRTGWSFFYFL